MSSVLENVLCLFEKKVYSAAVVWNVLYMSVRSAVPSLFGTRDWFRGSQFFHGPGGGVGWLRW